jgi:hypothetical protein
VTVRVQCGVCRQTLDQIETAGETLTLRGSSWWADPVPGPERPRIDAVDLGELSELPPRLSFICPRHGFVHLSREDITDAIKSGKSVLLPTNVLK